MITFSKYDEHIYLNYSVDYGDEDWVPKVLKETGVIRLKKTFFFGPEHFVTPNEDEEDDEDGVFDSPAFQFLFATLKGDYYKIEKGVIARHIDVYFYKGIDLDVSYFVADVNSPVFRLLEDVVEEPVFVGGDEQAAIPIEAFEKMLAEFPTPYEKKKYAEARISAILKNYLNSTKDSETTFQRYLNKRRNYQGSDLKKTFKEMEIIKYQTILEKVEQMLTDEHDYPEKKWQLEILQIIQLLYPKYIAVISNVPIRDKTVGDRILDFLLVDVNGHVDIVEIKKPFENSIMTQGRHRNNYIPLRELSGTIMQLEKYVFFLNRWGADGEKYLTDKYPDALPVGLEIKITNPGGIIIMGRENVLNADQRLDFEVVKRKYRNVVDIITYDNLVYRLKLIITQIKKI